MAGDVWEWVQSKDSEYPYRVDDGREDVRDQNAARVVRGGSFHDDQDGARCAYRDLNRPASRYVGRGFRVIVFPGSRS
jgi:formylglycine-generating enzyme required for sulfatase activity